MPKVSVLIPIYNCEKYLEKCIKSALDQTLKDIEIILINDGSNDSSPEIINKYASQDDRIKVINKSNSGYGASLNIAINEAKSDYISILESDDFLDSNFLKRLYEFKGHDVIKAGFYFYPENIQYKFNLEGLCTIEDNPEIINIKPSIWSAIYKKDFLIENNIKFNETKGASYQDVSFHFKTLYCAKSVYLINEPLYYYRTDNENSSVRIKTRVRAILNEFDTIYEFLQDKKILPETKNQLLLFELKAYIWNFIRISKFYENEFIVLSTKSLNKRDYDLFYKSKYIPFKYKLKLFAYLNYTWLITALLRKIKRKK